MGDTLSLLAAQSIWRSDARSRQADPTVPFLSLALLILRTCASASGIPTDRILGSVAGCLEGATGGQTP
jgi:hypothetical protein